jgi:hypothetical protein
MLGLVRYILSLLMVALVRNWDPGLSPDGSGRFGFVLALVLLKADFEGVFLIIKFLCAKSDMRIFFPPLDLFFIEIKY